MDNPSRNLAKGTIAPPMSKEKPLPWERGRPARIARSEAKSESLRRSAPMRAGRPRSRGKDGRRASSGRKGFTHGAWRTPKALRGAHDEGWQTRSRNLIMGVWAVGIGASPMVVVEKDRRLTDGELAVVRRRRRYARASLACEGLHLTPEDEVIFDQLERDRLSFSERRQILIERAHTLARSQSKT